MRMFDRPANRFRARVFGRAKPAALAVATQASTAADDFRVFALTFAGGFLFMAVYLA